MPNTTYGTPFVASSDLVSAYPGVSSNLATRLDQVSYAGNGLNNQTGTSYTLVLTDVGKTITLSNAAAVTVTIPANASVAAPVGSIIRFCNLGAGTVTVQPTGGVTLNGGNLTLPQYAAVQIVKLATDTWGVVESTGSVGGLTLIVAQTFSGAGSVSVNNCFLNTTDTYRIVISASGSGSAGLRLRMRLGGVDAGGASTYRNYQMLQNAGATIQGFYSTDSEGYAGFLSASPSIVTLDIASPASAAYTPVVSNASGDTWNGRNTFTHLVSTAYDGFSIYPASGTMTGAVRVYSYRNA